MLHDDNILPSVLPALEALNLLGISVFAVSGAVVAARPQQTFVTFIFFAVVTGVGGGTVRDLLIGAPVFWLHENLTLLICFLSAATVWLTLADRKSAGSEKSVSVLVDLVGDRNIKIK